MEYLEQCRAIEEEVDRFAAVAAGADPATNVPTCPGWDLAGLIKHIGTVHRWVLAMVRDRAASRVDRQSLELELPANESDYAEWLARGGRDLVQTLRAADPDASMWSWGPDQHVRFWSRRMLHETTVHRADAEMALGHAPAISTAAAIDGIDEFLENLPSAAAFAPRTAGLKGDGESLHWHAVDGEGEWMISLSAEGFSWRHGHGKGTVAVRGPAAGLLLLAYGRRRPDEFEVFGDRTLLDRWLAGSSI